MTPRYAVIGHPITHSKSPLIHGLFGQATGRDLLYTALEAPLAGFADAVRSFRDSGGRGMNVTVPFKVEAFQLADASSERAQQAGAANALKFVDDRIAADNFDGIGIVNDIQRNLGLSLRGRRVLLLGAGGGVRGVLGPLLAERPATVAIANRTAAKAQQLAARFAADAAAAELRGGGYDELAGSRFDVVINATAASLQGEPLPLPDTVWAPDALAYEMLYGKGLTPFLRQARAAGVLRVADGLGMLVEQAAEAFQWWHGVRPATAPVIERLTVPLT